MRPRMIAGNWKMHGSKAMATELVSTLIANTSNLQHVDIAVIPPFVYLDLVHRLVSNSTISLGAQNVAEHESGAYTGEISASMLSDVGCKFVLIGHSERRQYYGDSNESIAEKFQLAQKAGLIPIFCMGETQSERQSEQTFNIIKSQLNSILLIKNGVKLLQNAILAYEPVWAIGTGQTATPEQAQEVHKYIRRLLAEHDIALAQQIQILYGGSVKSTNADKLFAMDDIDGGLIGGASLNVNEFMEICKCSL